MAECLGRNRDTHCCWIKGKVCRFLEQNSEHGYKWSCGLRRELGSWDEVTRDPRYIESIQPFWDGIGTGLSCANYPNEIAECRECYPVNHG